MKKEFNTYLEEIKTYKVKELAELSSVSEDLIRKYLRGETYPRLPTAVLLNKNFDIPCEFWIENLQKNKK